MAGVTKNRLCTDHSGCMFATPAWLKKLEKLDLSGQPWQKRVKKPAERRGRGRGEEREREAKGGGEKLGRGGEEEEEEEEGRTKDDGGGGGGGRGKRGRENRKERRERVSSSQNPMEVRCMNSHTVPLTPDTHIPYFLDFSRPGS